MGETVEHNARKSRFEIHVDGALAGIAHYDLSNGVADFDHTEVQPRFNGRGLGTTLVRDAFDQVRAQGQWRIRASCSFVKGFVKRHPEYDDLIVD